MKKHDAPVPVHHGYLYLFVFENNSNLKTPSVLLAGSTVARVVAVLLVTAPSILRAVDGSFILELLEK